MFPSMQELMTLPDPQRITDPATGAQYYVEPAGQVFERTLAANAAAPDLTVTFDRDAEFIWSSLVGTSTGLYTIQVRLPNNRLISSAQIISSNWVGTAPFPQSMFPPVRVGPGSALGLNLTDISNAQNTIRLLFWGYRRYKLS